MLHIPRTCPATWSLLFGLISVTACAALPDRALARDRASHAHLCRAMAEVLFDYSSSEWSMAEHRRERAEKAGQPDAVVAPLRALEFGHLRRLREAEALRARYASAPEPDFDLRMRLQEDFEASALWASARSDCSEAAAASATPPLPSPTPTSRQPAPHTSGATMLANTAGRGGRQSQDIRCPSGHRASGIEIRGAARVTGIALACAAWAPGALRSGGGQTAGRVGLTDGSPRVLSCAPDRWLTAIQTEHLNSTVEGGVRVISFARPLCRGEAALPLNDDAAVRSVPYPAESDIQRTDCPLGPAVGLRVGFDQSVKSLTLICPL
ncbi:MAG: hypothetical protein ACT6RD_12930 [Brevundimonas sp.]